MKTVNDSEMQRLKTDPVALDERINRYLLIGAGDTTEEAVEGNYIAEAAREQLRYLRSQLAARDADLARLRKDLDERCDDVAKVIKERDEARAAAQARHDAADAATELRVKLHQSESRERGLRAQLQDFADHGIRHDTNPSTIHPAGETHAQLAMFYSRYIQSIDEYVRRYARKALADAPAPPAQTTCDESKGEWRCACASDPKFDTSINPAFVQRCNKCGAERPAQTTKCNCGSTTYHADSCPMHRTVECPECDKPVPFEDLCCAECVVSAVNFNLATVTRERDELKAKECHCSFARFHDHPRGAESGCEFAALKSAQLQATDKVRK